MNGVKSWRCPRCGMLIVGRNDADLYEKVEVHVRGCIWPMLKA
jgi:uncharacterized C2H2 Zn-finger protein